MISKKEDKVLEKRGMSLLIALAITFIFIPIILAQYVPQTLSINGRLTDTNGGVQVGTYIMNFTIYDNDTGGNPLWSSGNLSVVTDANGIYSQRLINIALNFSQAYYLTIRVQGEAEMTPRINLTATGWAIRARNISVSGVEFTSNVDLNNYNLTTDGRIGIGVSTPAALFEIAKAGAGIFGLNVSGIFYVNDSNVGIGTTSPAGKLHVNATGESAVFGDSPLADYWVQFREGTNAQEIGFSDAAIISGTTGQFLIKTSSDKGFAIKTGDSTTFSSITDADFVINDAGSVGIGTTSPTHTLNVNGTTNLSGMLYVDSNAVSINTTSTTYKLNVLGDATFTGVNSSFTITPNEPPSSKTVLAVNFAGLNSNGVQMRFGGIGTGVDIGLSNTGDFIIESADEMAIRINRSSRNVGIGVTSPAHIFETSMGSGVNEINLSGVVYVNSTSGRVGIGTTAPGYTLDVTGTVDLDPSGTGRLRVTATGADVDGNLTVSSGSVGIGTTSPTHTLNVNGSTNLSGEVIIENNLSFDRWKDAFGGGSQGANLIPISADAWRTRTDFWAVNSLAAESITIVDAPNSTYPVPTGKAHEFNDSNSANWYVIDHLIPINPNLTYYGRIWAANVSSNSSSRFYAGYIAYDKNLKVLSGNGGTYGYFIANFVLPSQTGTWYYGTISGEGTATTTFPISTRYIKPLIIVHYPQGGSTRVAGFEISDRPFEQYDGSYELQTQGMDRLTVDKSGNISLNNTLFVDAGNERVGVGLRGRPPLAKLHINGSTSASEPLLIVNFTHTSPTGYVAKITRGNNVASGGNENQSALSILDSASNIPFYVETSAYAPLFIINGSGQVGIGTRNPGATLDVAGASSGFVRVNADSGGGYIKSNYDLNLYADSGADNSASFSEIHFFIDDVEKMILNSSGYLGIGTIIPSHTLNVNGTANITGLCVSGRTRLRRKKKKGKGWEEVEIKDIKEGDEIASLDEKTGKVVWRKVKKLLDMGVKSVYRLKTDDGRSIVTTAAHPYLVLDVKEREVKHVSPIKNAGWIEAKNIKPGDYIAVTKPRAGIFIDNANMFYSQKKANWKVDYRKLVELLKNFVDVKFVNYYTAIPEKKDSAYIKVNNFIETLKSYYGEMLTFKTKPLKYILSGKQVIKKGDMDVKITVDVLDNIKDLDTVIILSGDSDFADLAERVLKENKKIIFASFKENMGWELRQKKHIYLNQIRELVEYKDKEQPSAEADVLLLKKQAPEKTGVLLLNKINEKQLYKAFGLSLSSENKDNDFIWSKVISVEAEGNEHVYDIEVEGTHNFIGDDIIAHNTYIANTLFVNESSVGIGTFNPRGALTVNSSNAGGSLRVYNTTGSEHLFVKGTTGYVGINTDSPSSELHIDGGAGSFPVLIVEDDTRPSIRLKSTSSGAQYNFIQLDSATKDLEIGLRTDNGLLYFNPTLGQAETGSIMVLNNTGYLGLGLTTPRFILHVNGTANITDDTYIANTLFVNESSVGVGTKSPSYSLDIPSENATLRIGDRLFASTEVSVNASDYANLTHVNGGALDSIYQYRVYLNVMGTGTDTGSSYIVWYDPDVPNWTIRNISRAGSSSNHPELFLDDVGVPKIKTSHASLYQVSVSTEALFVEDNDALPHIWGSEYMWQRNVDDLFYLDGNVGIGTTGPQAKLEIAKAGAGIFGLNVSGILYVNDSNVGIGTTSPTQKLYVVGNIFGTGNVSAYNINMTEDSKRTYVGLGVGGTPSVGAEGSSTTFVGYQAGYQSNGTQSTALGYQAGYNNTGQRSIAVGYQAGYNNIGKLSAALGYQAGYNSIGEGTTALGYNAGLNNAGNFLTALGYSAGDNNLGNFSVALGYNAGLNNAGNNLVAIGYQAGLNNALPDQFIVKQANVNSVPLIQGNFSSGNVGIGTTSPVTLLEIVGTVSDGDGSGQVRIRGTNAKLILNGTGASNDVKVIFAPGGARQQWRVGLEASAGSIFKIEEGSTDRLAIGNGTGYVGIGVSSPSSLFEVSKGSGVNEINLSGVVYVNSTSGNVGIGTSSPGAKLEVIGTLNISNSSGTGLGLFQDSAGNVGIGTTGPATTLHIGAGSGAITIPDGAGTLFTPEVSIQDTSGISGLSVGIGDGTNNRRAGLFVDQTNAIWGLSQTHTTGAIPFAIRMGSNERLRIDTSGNVGIGTTSPKAKFDVSNSSQGVVIHPTGGLSDSPYINTTLNNLTITSKGGSVIIKLG